MEPMRMVKYMYRKILLLGTILIFGFAIACPVQAISYGMPDGNDHPNVCAVLMQLDDKLYKLGTGTLISENVVLTAGHVTAIIDQNPDSFASVSFDPTVTGSSTFYDGVAITNPDYYSIKFGRSNPSDIGVIVLDEGPGITPATLPEVGLLDELKAEDKLVGTQFTTVGYGQVRNTRQAAWQVLLTNSERYQTDQGALSLTDAWITMSGNQATGNGGTCYGDSGGPHFIHLDGEETDIVAAITVTGDRWCKATDKDYRIDTEEALGFIHEILDRL